MPDLNSQDTAELRPAKMKLLRILEESNGDFVMYIWATISVYTMATNSDSQ